MTIKTTTRTLQLALLLAACLVAAQNQAQVCRVTVDGTDTGDGGDWNTQAMDLHTALGDAGCGQIWVAGGVYKPHASDESVSFTIDRQVEVYGGFAGTETMLGERDPAVNLTILSGDIDNNDTVNADGVTETAGDIAGNNSYHVVFVNGTSASGPVTATTVVDGFIITAGQADATVFPDTTGGGLLCTGIGNNNECSPTLNRIIFSGNSATQGGGAMFNDANSSGSSSPVINNATFSGNSSGTNGGAIYNRGVFNGISSPELNSVTFSGNSAVRGGAIYSFGENGASSPTLNNVTFNGNTASGSGGAMANWGDNGASSPALNNVTFSGNFAAITGGAMFNTGTSGTSQPVLNNVIAWDNAAGIDGPEIDNNNAAPAINDSIVAGGCPVGGNCTNVIDADPLLGALADNGGFTQTMPPGITGAAIDAGNNASCLSEDQRGIPRPQGPTCDIGAVELAFPIVDVTVSGQGVADVAATPVPVSGGITACDAAGQGQSHCMATYTVNDAVTLILTPDASWHLESVTGCDGVRQGNSYTTTPLQAGCNVNIVFAANRLCRVTTAGTATGDGSDWMAEAMDLQSALGDTGCTEIWVAGGVYKPDASDANVSFTIDREVEVYGGFDGTETDLEQRDPSVNLTILSGDIDNNDTVNADGVTETAGDIAGNNSYHVMFVNGTAASGPVTATTVVDGLIITAGQADGVAFPDNAGGGLMCNGTGSTGECSPTLNNVIFSGNSADMGGGAIFNDGSVDGASSPIITNATFSGNSSGADGGAIINFGDGGVSSPTMTNDTFSGNTASGSGGAMANWGDNGVSSSEVINVTFNGNSASVSGGAIYNTGTGGTSEPTLGHLIAWGNSAPTGAEIHNNNAAPQVVYSIVEGGCPAGSTCNNNIDADPLLGPLADNGGFTQTFLPAAASPAIDAGFPPACPDEDQRGIARPQGSGVACDLGSVERGVPLVTVEVIGMGVVDAAASPAPVDGSIAGCTAAGQGQPQCMATYADDDVVELNFSPAVSWQLQSAAGCDGVLSGNTFTTGPLIAQCTVVVVFEPVPGYIHYVDQTATGANDGSSWTDAFNEVRDAMVLAGTGQQIRVAAGVYYPTANPGDRGASFHLVDGVEIYGGFPSGGDDFENRDWETNVTVLSGDIGGDDVTNSDGVTETAGDIVGDNSTQIVIGDGTTATAVLDGFFITAAYGHNVSSNFQGGGLSNNHGSPTLANLNFSGNRAYAGGGLYNLNGSPSLTNITFSGNSAFNGGGMFNSSNYSTMTNVVFSNNQADNQGGGLRNFSSSPVMTNVDFIDNLADDGGGMFNTSDSNPSLTDVVFSGNQADSNGGGMFNNLNSSPTLITVSFSDNQADSNGGGMYSHRGNPALTQVDFDGNQAEQGGGMFNDQSSPAVENVSYRGNQANLGGGMYNLSASNPTLTNVIFSGNLSSFVGGGMLNFDSTPTLTNVSFSGNRSANQGGGMFNNQDSNPVLINTVFWNNFGSGSMNFTSSSIYNQNNSAPDIAWSLVANCNPGGAWNTACGTDGGNNLPDADPLFVDTPDPADAPTIGGDLRLQAGSPAVNAGDPATDPGLFPGGPGDPVDLEGNLRFSGGVIDLGPYELQPPMLTFDPEELDFGEVEIGTGAASLSATLHNAGGDATGLSFPVSGAPGFSVTGGDCAAVLPAGDNCQIEVSFLPPETGTGTAILEATGDNSIIFAELPLTGTGTQPGLQLTPDSLVFGNIPVGETSTPLTLTLTSTGTAALTVDELAGPEPPFAPAGNGSDRGTPLCGVPPFTLMPGQSCDLDFQFSPDAVGNAASTLTVAGNAPSSPDEVILSGTGTAAILELNPGFFEFELVTGHSGGDTLFIGNDGNIDLDWNIAAESECGAGVGGEWLSADPQADTTAPQDATDVQLTASAAALAAGQYDAVLCVSSNALGAPEVAVPVSLTVTAPDLYFDPPELDFGNVEIDTASTPLTASLYNGGDADATGLEFLVPAGFTADTDDCGNSLPAGESCQLAVTFAPVETGAVDDMLIVDSAEGAVAELRLAGSGVPPDPGLLNLDPAILDFGNVNVGDTREEIVTVANAADAGSAALDLTVIETGGAAEFEISGGDCAVGTTLPPGESCVIELRFSPSGEGAVQGVVQVQSADDQAAELDLSGTGTLPMDDIFSDRFEP